MRLFVSEFVCGGGWSSPDRPDSLVREGAAMLRALVSDAIAAGWEVVATWDRRLTIPDELRQRGLELIPVDDSSEERERFTQLCRDTDATYVIAPELDEELTRRVTVAQAHSRRCLNASVEAVDLCGDKWAFFQHCQRVGLPTIETWRLANAVSHQFAGPHVVKLRLGAGSQQMKLVARDADLPLASETHRSAEFLVQPFLSGHSISVGAIVWSEQRYELFPIVDQFIDPARGFEYGGGRIPSRWNVEGVRALARRVIESIPGLLGYIGIDMLVPDSNPAQLVVVEVNPRLTTSYIGYRQLCRENLIHHWLEEVTTPLTWMPGVITFDCQGVVQ